MKNKEQILKLSEEAKNLIIESRNESSILIGENLLKSINVSEDGLTFTIESTYDGIEEFELTDISSVFRLEMDGQCAPLLFMNV